MPAHRAFCLGVSRGPELVLNRWRCSGVRATDSLVQSVRVKGLACAQLGSRDRARSLGALAAVKKHTVTMERPEAQEVIGVSEEK